MIRLAARLEVRRAGALEVAEHRVTERLVSVPLLVTDSIDGAVGPCDYELHELAGRFTTLSSRSMIRS